MSLREAKRRTGTLDLNDAAELAKEVYTVDWTGTGVDVQTNEQDLVGFPEPPQMPRPTTSGRRREAFIKTGPRSSPSTGPRSSPLHSPMRRVLFNDGTTATSTGVNTLGLSQGEVQAEAVCTTDEPGLLLKKQIVRPTLRNLEKKWDVKFDYKSKQNINNNLQRLTDLRSAVLNLAGGGKGGSDSSDNEEDLDSEVARERSAFVKQSRWIREHKEPRPDYKRSKAPMVARPRGLHTPPQRHKPRPAPSAQRRNEEMRVRSIRSHGAARGRRDGKVDEKVVARRARARTSSPHATVTRPSGGTESEAASPRTVSSSPARDSSTTSPRLPESHSPSRGSIPSGMDFSSRHRARMSQRLDREQTAVKVLIRQQQILDLRSIKEKNNLDSLLPEAGYASYFIRLFAARRVKRIIGESCVKVRRMMVRHRIALDMRRADEEWAGKVLIRAWKKYRLRSFGWHLVQHLRDHKAREKRADELQHDAFRLRAAYRRLDETEALLSSDMYNARLKRKKNHEAWLVLQEEMRERREDELNEAREKENEAFLLAEKAKEQLEQEQKMRRIANNVVKFGGKRMSGYSGLAKKKKKKRKQVQKDRNVYDDTDKEPTYQRDAKGRTQKVPLYQSNAAGQKAQKEGYMQDWVRSLAVNVGGLGPNGELGVKPFDHDHVSHMLSLRAPPPSFNKDVSTAAPIAGVDMSVPPGWRLEKRAAFEDPRSAVHDNDFYVYNSHQEAEVPVENVKPPTNESNAKPRVIYPPGVDGDYLESGRLKAQPPPDWEARARVPLDLGRELNLNILYRYGGARRLEEQKDIQGKDSNSSRYRRELLEETVTNNFLPRKQDVWGHCTSAQRAIEQVYGIRAAVIEEEGAEQELAGERRVVEGGEGANEAKGHGDTWEGRARVDTGVVASTLYALSTQPEDEEKEMVEERVSEAKADEMEDQAGLSGKQASHSPEKSQTLQLAHPFIHADSLHYDISIDDKFGFKGFQHRLAPHDGNMKKLQEELLPLRISVGEESQDDPFGLGLEPSHDLGDMEEGSLAQESISVAGGAPSNAGGISDRVKDFLERVDAQRPPAARLDEAGNTGEAWRLGEPSTRSTGIVQVRSSSGGYQPARVFGVARSTDDVKMLQAHDYYRATPLLGAKTSMPNVSVSLDAPSLSHSLRARVGLSLKDRCEEGGIV